MDFFCNKALMRSSTSGSTQSWICRIIALLAWRNKKSLSHHNIFLPALLHRCNEMQMLWNICQVQAHEKVGYIYVFFFFFHLYSFQRADDHIALLQDNQFIQAHMQTVAHTVHCSITLYPNWIAHPFQTYNASLCTLTIFPNRTNVHWPMQINCLQERACVAIISLYIASLDPSYINVNEKYINNATTDLTLCE